MKHAMLLQRDPVGMALYQDGDTKPAVPVTADWSLHDTLHPARTNTAVTLTPSWISSKKVVLNKLNLFSDNI